MDKLFFLLLLGVSGCSALMGSLPVISFGPCPNYSPVSYLNLTAYAGVWYEIEKFPAGFEHGAKCIHATYTLMENDQGPYVRVNNTGLKNGVPDIALGVATQPDPPSGALIVHFDGQPTPTEPNYNILEVDTSSYVLIYSCGDILGVAHLEFAWILAREPTLSDDAIQHLKNTLQQNGADPSHFTVTDQTDCYY